MSLCFRLGRIELHMNEKCQKPADVFICGEVLKRTEIEFNVTGRICEKCSPKLIENMCKAARSQRKRNKRSRGGCARGRRKIENILIGWTLLLLRVNNEEIQRRAENCRTCEMRLRFNFCWICLCYIPAMIRVFRKRCVLGKWSKGNEDRN